MKSKTFQCLVLMISLFFTVFFVWTVVPPLMLDFDVIGAMAAGFVNPYASGYSMDVIACWFILVVWIVYERQHAKLSHGWLCALLGLVPGVAVGFGAYLILRHRQFAQQP